MHLLHVPERRRPARPRTCEGSILFAPRGENGFGYDPVFQPDGYACSMAELRPEEKNAISHRGNALKILKEELRNYYADK